MKIADIRKFVLFGERKYLQLLDDSNIDSKLAESLFLHVVDLRAGLRADQIDEKARALQAIKRIEYQPDSLERGFYDHAFDRINNTGTASNIIEKIDSSSAKSFFWSFYLRTNANILEKPSAGSPLRMFQFWDKEPPHDVAEAMAEWACVFGTHRYELFNEENARVVIRDSLGIEGVAAYDACWHPAMKSDLFRAVELAERGGIYIDSDMVPVKGALDYLRRCNNEVHFWLRTDQPNGAIFNGVLFARPKSRIMTLYSEYCIAEIAKNPGGSPVNTTGPGVLRKAMQKIYGNSNDIDATSSGRFELINQFAKPFATSYRGDNRSWQRAIRN